MNWRKNDKTVVISTTVLKYLFYMKNETPGPSGSLSRYHTIRSAVSETRYAREYGIVREITVPIPVVFFSKNFSAFLIK